MTRGSFRAFVCIVVYLIAQQRCSDAQQPNFFQVHNARYKADATHRQDRPEPNHMSRLHSQHDCHLRGAPPLVCKCAKRHRQDD